MKDLGTVITFYSYKGGTGRTMALANTGVELARKSAGKVLMVDWDLEAPGLHDFFPEVEVERRKHERRPAGLLELFERANEYSERAFELSRENACAFWDNVVFDEHVARTDEPSLHLMRAGRFDPDYGTRVSSLPWRDLFERCPDMFKAFAERLAAEYDYVLIDSRTGLTDSSGICTMLLPDRLVVVFNPNRQSLSGGIDLARRATAYRSQSADARPLIVFPLASRVEISEDELRRRWRYGSNGIAGYQPQFERLFEEAYGLPVCDLEQYFDEVQIQHTTSYAYGERIAVREESSDRLSLARSYQRFVHALQATKGPWLFKAAEAADRSPKVAADHVLAEMEAARRFHLRLARRARRWDAIAIGGIGLVALVIVSIAFARAFGSVEFDSTSLLLAGTLLIFTIELSRRFFAFNAVYESHARAASSLGKERALFLAGARPYGADENPVTLLVERFEGIGAESQEAVLLARRGQSLFNPRQGSSRDL